MGYSCSLINSGGGILLHILLFLAASYVFSVIFWGTKKKFEATPKKKKK